MILYFSPNVETQFAENSQMGFVLFVIVHRRETAFILAGMALQICVGVHCLCFETEQHVALSKRFLKSISKH